MLLIFVVSHSSYFGHSLCSCLFCLVLMNSFVPDSLMTPIPIRPKSFGGRFFILAEEITFRLCIYLCLSNLFHGNMERKQEKACLNHNEKTNHKWDIDCWRLCWHLLRYYVEFKGFGVFNHALDFERLHSI